MKTHTRKVSELMEGWQDSQMQIALTLLCAVVPKESRPACIKAMYDAIPEGARDEYLALWECHQGMRGPPSCLVEEGFGLGDPRLN